NHPHARSGNTHQPYWQARSRQCSASAFSDQALRRTQIAIARGSIHARLPAGSFFGGFRTTAPTSAAPSRRAVIRNPFLSRDRSASLLKSPLERSPWPRGISSKAARFAVCPRLATAPAVFPRLRTVGYTLLPW